MNMIEFLRGLVGEEVVIHWYPGAQSVGISEVMVAKTPAVVEEMNETILTLRYSKGFFTLNLEDVVVYAVETKRPPSLIFGEKEVKKR